MTRIELKHYLLNTTPVLLFQRMLNQTGRQAVYLGDHTLMLRTLNGLHLYLDSRDESLTPFLLKYGVWEAPMTKALLRLLKPGMRVLEVGANIGYFTTIMAMKVGPKGKLWSFDAQERQVELAQRSLHINGFNQWTRLEHLAVSNVSGTVSFRSLKKRHGSSSLFPHAPDLIADANDETVEIQVPCTSLDAYFGADMPHIDLLRMDAEGAEPHIIEGMSGLLQANPNIKMILEYNTIMLKSGGRDPRGFLTRLRELGFSIKALDGRGRWRRLNQDQADQADNLELLLERQS